LEKEAFRLRKSGLGGEEDRAGVIAPRFGEGLLVEDVADSFVDVHASPAERLS